MQTHELKPKNKNKSSKRVGRGGSRGKTSGRGHKGQNARAGRKKRPEIRDLIKKLPKLRGRGINSNTPVSIKPFVVNLSQIDTVVKDGDKVTPALLVKKGLVKITKGKKPAVKILGTGEITKKITVANVSISESAKAKVEKAGGTIL